MYFLQVITNINRSVKFCDDGEKVEQVNAITHFVDASNVYGSDKNDSRFLR